MSMAMVRDAFPILGRTRFHYLDSAAMALCPEVVIQAVARHDRDARANIRRAVHAQAQKADAAYDGARARVAGFLGAKDEEVVFTPGCTAALNLAAASLAEMLALGPGDRVVTTGAEHHSALLPWLMQAKRRGFTVERLPVGTDGRLDLSDLSLIDGTCKVVAATHCSNVTGAVTDLARLSQAARNVGALLVVDGAQAVPHGPVSLPDLGADLYAFAGHKAYGPTGIGVLWGKALLLERMPPALWGGGMVGGLDEEGGIGFLEPPHRFEAGTPPVAQAVGLAAALDWMASLDWQAVHAHEQDLTRRLIGGLSDLGAHVVGPLDLEARLPVVSFTLAGCHPHDLAHLLAEDGVAVRGGAHCARPLMDRLGLDEGCLRASLAPYNDHADVEALLASLARAVKVLR